MSLRMKIYTAHVKPDVINASENPVFVKEGFNFFAFFFTVFWALYHRLWLASFLILAYNVSLALLLKNHEVSPLAALTLHFGMHIFIGLQGNDWLRARLARRGYILADISAGDSLLRAEQRYFERLLTHA